MSNSLSNFIEKISGLADEFQSKAELMAQDLIEPLDMYQKHYKATSKGILDQGDEIWTNLHMERTEMLFMKENYYNQMYQLNDLQKKLKGPSGVKNLEGPSLSSQINFQMLSAQEAEQSYKERIETVNQRVE